MKKIYTLLVALLPLFATAQFTYDFSGDSAKVDYLGIDVDYDLEVVNLSSTNQTVRWRILSNAFPSSSWQDYVCDEVCYTPNKRWNDIILKGDTTFPIIHHIRMKVDTGLGTSTLCFFNPNDSANTLQCKTLSARALPDTTTAVAKVIARPTGSLSQNSPNPFISRTSINYELISNTGFIRVHDLTGKLVKQIPLSNQKGQVIISDHLDAGLYFYSLWDDNKMVASKRMQVIE